MVSVTFFIFRRLDIPFVGEWKWRQEVDVDVIVDFHLVEAASYPLRGKLK